LGVGLFAPGGLAVGLYLGLIASRTQTIISWGHAVTERGADDGGILGEAVGGFAVVCDDIPNARTAAILRTGTLDRDDGVAEPRRRSL
jgi:hypothetical protein